MNAARPGYSYRQAIAGALRALPDRECQLPLRLSTTTPRTGRGWSPTEMTRLLKAAAQHKRLSVVRARS
jgi:hypothetical protein